MVGWGLCGTFLLLFLLTFVLLTRIYTTAFIEGGKLALVNAFCVPLLPTADELNCFYLLHVTYDYLKFCMD